MRHEEWKKPFITTEVKAPVVMQEKLQTQVIESPMTTETFVS
jgi:hypothetical protein